MTLPKLKTHLAEQIALADGLPPDWKAIHGDSYCAYPSLMTEKGAHFLVYDSFDTEGESFESDLRNPGIDAVVDFCASARTNLPKLCRQVKVALEVIEERPHDEHCDVIAAAIWNAWSPDQKVGTCNCSKARAIARILEAGV